MDTILVVIAILLAFIIAFFIYNCIGRGEHFENREEKQRELFKWFQKNGNKKSYDTFKHTFADKKADIVDFEKGRRGARDGSLSPDDF